MTEYPIVSIEFQWETLCTFWGCWCH